MFVTQLLIFVDIHLVAERVPVDGWDCSFPSDLSAHFHQTNDSTVEDLLGGFFQFYAKCDFSGSVISIREARSVELSEFNKLRVADQRLTNFRVLYIFTSYYEGLMISFGVKGLINLGLLLIVLCK